MEMIMRFNDSSDDVEIITKNESGNILGKLVNIKECANELVKVCSIDFDNLEINNLDGNLLYFNRKSKTENYIIRFPERKIKCTYDSKGYSIIHPNTIFKLEVDSASKRYQNIQAYCYKEYKGIKTELYLYPFPNMLGSNSICTGTISRDATDPMIAILNVIEGNYTHSTTACKKYKKTLDFFKAIKKEFPYDVLEKNGMSLGALIKK